MLKEICVLSRFSRVRLFATPWTRLLCPRDSPGRNTAVGRHALLQGIFPTRGQTCVPPSPAGQATSATWRPRHVSTLESCFFLAVQGLRSRTALTRNPAHALRWKPWVWTTRPPGKSTGEDPPRWAWPWFQASAWPRGPGWGTDLLESGVPRARWASCPTLCPAEPGARRKAHSGVGYLSSSYLILPAPVLQVLPSAHPEHRRKKELWS